MLLVLLAFAVAPPVAPPPPVPTPGLAARCIGPAVMGGRIPSLDVVESDPRIQYVAAAAGGIWKTIDDGASWKCVFPGAPHPSMGAVAVAPSDPRVVYVGTGEANMRNSVSAGNGVFVSRDAGRTWTHAGLEETRHIGRIAVHPTDADTAFVAALGRGWGPNPERGLFRTRDGGKTWEHVLKLDDDTGCVDVVVDPIDPKHVHAAAYSVRRGPYMGGNPATQFGKLAGIYRSADGGATFKRATKGLPARPMGRIGLAVWRKAPRIVMAVVQSDATDATRLPGQPPTPAEARPGPADTGGVFRSEDRGETWRKVNDLCPRPFYFSKIRIDPADDKNVWVLGIPLWASRDGGKSFALAQAKNVHVDHHALWIDPRDSGRMILGNDGGLYRTRNGGRAWEHVNNLPISQFYCIAVDEREPYRVYGGLQDNGTWSGLSRSSDPAGIPASGWRRLLGMDGFHCAVPPNDPDTAYAEGQYGRPFRIDLRTGRGQSIRPRVPRGQPEHRFNWSSPMILSPHSSRTLWYGGEVVFKSSDRGDNWRVVSPDLTRGQPRTPSRENGHTLTALSESPVSAGVLWAGSDDGRVHVTRDGGVEWAEVGRRLPGVQPGRGARATGHVTRIEPSPHHAGTAWLALDRHRQDDDRPHLFRTRDHGRTWVRATRGLPARGPVLALRADSRNRGLLFAGTELGLYCSFDDGDRWQALECGLPPAPVHDLAIHPTARELVVATHGRGIWIVDAAPLQEWEPGIRKAAALLAVRSPYETGPKSEPAARSFAGENPPPGYAIYYSGGAGRIEVLLGKDVAASWRAEESPGVHRVQWVPARAGDYVLRLGADLRRLSVKAARKGDS